LIRRTLSVRLVGATVAIVGLLSATPRAALAQNAPPVDQAEGGAADSELRIGTSVVSGSAWIDGHLRTGLLGREDRGTLRGRRGRFGISGAVTSWVGYSLSAELSAQPELRNAFVVFRITGQTSVRVGQANPISALERGTSPMSLELIDRSAVTSTLTGPSDIGVSIFSTEPYRKWLGYALNVTNGSGFNRADNNRSKDLSGRIAISPLVTPGLLVVVSGARGDQPGGLRTRAGLGLDYRRGAWHLLVEVLRQRRDNLPVSDGYVAMVAYRHRPQAPRRGLTQVEYAARVWVLNDRATAAGVPSTLVNDDGGDVGTGEGLITTREFQGGVNVYLTTDVRLMGNVVVPFDDRPHGSPRVLMRWQIQF
jgi:hypothetical protein